ncbi:MAG: cellulase family glycosylhydrolase [Chitinispirillales bacterium]|jgi:endoglucanase|nr:cellulase family glycosylhydrolase [Chitinispirillales bacterium]
MKTRPTAIIRTVLMVAAITAAAHANITIGNIPGPNEYVAPAGSPVATYGQLRVGTRSVGGVANRGVILSNNAGAGSVPVTLRGMSFFWGNTPTGRPYYTDPVTGWLVDDWRVSVVRPAVASYNELHGGGNPGFADGDSLRQLNQARTVIEAAIRRGIYVIVDWHTHSVRHRASAENFFRIIAQEYGQYPNVLFEPFNEPDPRSQLPSNSVSNIRDFVQPIINVIRQAGSNNLIIVGTPNWSSEPNAFNNAGDRPTDSQNNLAYSMHFYANTHRQTHRDRVTAAVNAGLAVFATEFGTTNADGGGTNCPNNNCNGHSVDQNETTTWLNFLEGLHVGWANWSVTHLNEGASILTSAASTPDRLNSSWPLSVSGNYIRGQIRSRNDTYFTGSLTTPLTYSIANATVAAGQGTVQRFVNGVPNNGPYTFGTVVEIRAVPAAGYRFLRWGGEASGTASSFTYRVVGLNVTDIRAEFVEGSMITNGDFTLNINGWQSVGVNTAHDLANGTMRVNSTNNPGTMRVFQRRRVATSADPLAIDPIAFNYGMRYELEFRARATTGSVTITPRITNHGVGAAVNHMPVEPITLTTSWQTITRTFDMCSKRAADDCPIDEEDGALVFAITATGDWEWFLDDVKLNEVGPAATCDINDPCEPTSVSHVVSARPDVWSVSRSSGNGIRLHGPALASGARVILYDARGRAVRTLAARDGLVIGRSAGIPAGTYFMVLRDAAGTDVLRTRVVVAR